MRKPLLLIVLILVLLICVLVLATARFFYEWGMSRANRQQTTTQSLSPNERYSVILKEKVAFIDRNFKIILEDMKSGKQQVLFNSPDEGTKGSERFLWSADGSYFILLGRHFNVIDGSLLPDGEQMYLFYRISDKHLWCNASQVNADRFNLKILEKLGLGAIPSNIIPETTTTEKKTAGLLSGK